MPITKNAGFRFRIIDSCLRNKLKRYPTLFDLQETITEALNLDSIISESSINKDLKAMKTHWKAPIKFDKTNKGYYYDDPDFSINSFPLTSEEIRILDLSVSFLKQIKFSGFFYQFESTIEKLISGFRISKIEGFENNNILETEEPLADLGSNWINVLYEAILYKNCIEINYKRYNSDHNNLHTFSPFVIREYRNRWYVTGYSLLSKTLLTLALDRILSIEPSKKPYHFDPNFNAADYFKYAFGVTTYLDTEPETVTLFIDTSVASYIISKPLHRSQKVKKVENGIEITMECYLTPELEMVILGYGEHVKVLSPEKLVKKIKSRIQSMNKLIAD